MTRERATTNRHRLFFLFAAGLFLCGIPFCRPMMSFGLILLSANWLAEGRWREKWESIRKQPMLWIVLLLYLVHIFGLLYTENWQYALQDLIIKLPLLIVPLVFATTAPLSQKEFKLLLNIYLIAVCLSAFIGLVHFLTNSELTDKRSMAVYISYIRFELNLCFALFISIWFCKQQWKTVWKWFYFAAIIWITSIIVYIGAFTAIALAVFAFVFLLIRLSIKRKEWYYHRLMPLILLIITGSSLFIISFYVRQYTHTNFDFATADKYTINGNPYCDTLETKQIENNMYVYAYVCDQELQKAWESRSSMDYRYYAKDNSHVIRMSLIRYLNSKGLRKDSLGMSQLSDEEIRMIEQGVSNIVYLSENGFKVRFYENLWEITNYLRFGKGLGSVPQRIEAWKISVKAIKEQPWLGTGTGDVKDVFLQTLNKEESPIRGILIRSHNQYLSFGMAFGIVGLTIILFSFLYPLFKLPKRHILYYIFLLIFMISMFTDDPLERQDGVCFFAVFNSLFLFLKR